MIYFFINHLNFLPYERKVVYGLIGGTVLIATAVAAYVKREAIKQAAKEISDDVKRRLKKNSRTKLQSSPVFCPWKLNCFSGFL